MSAGGESVLYRDPWLARASSITGAPAYEAPAEVSLAERHVWIIDPQTLFRRGLALLMQQWNPGIAVLDSPDIAAALAGLGQRPALVLVDAVQAGQQHFSGLAQLVAEVPGAPLVLLAAETEWKAAMRAVELGARGYLPKSASEAVLRHALGLVASGEVYLPRQCFQQVIGVSGQETWASRRRHRSVEHSGTETHPASGPRGHKSGGAVTKGGLRWQKTYKPGSRPCSPWTGSGRRVSSSCSGSSFSS